MMARAVLEWLTDSVYSLLFSLLMNEKKKGAQWSPTLFIIFI